MCACVGEVDAPAPPEVGTEVIIQEDEVEFAGTVESIDTGLLMTCLMTVTKEPTSFILSDRRGYVRFGKASHCFV